MTDAELIVHWLDLRLRANGRQGIRGSDIDMMREIRDDIAAGRYHPTTWNAHPAGKPRPFTSEQLTEAARDAAADEELPPHPQVLRPAKIHVLKCWPAYFEAMRVGRKSFEVRRNDRDFQVGDCIVVQEYNPELGRLSGEAFSVRVVYMLAGGQFGMPEGYCVMGIEDWTTPEKKGDDWSLRPPFVWWTRRRESRGDAGIPRRACLDQMTPAEIAIVAAVEAVDAAGADERLTHAVIALQEARNLVADFVDGVPFGASATHDPRTYRARSKEESG